MNPVVLDQIVRQQEEIEKLRQQRDELLDDLYRIIDRFDRFPVPFSLAELRPQLFAAIAKCKES